MITDEVLTGFGRCGDWFASSRAGIQPDLMALSKGLTGGCLPMGVTMASERVFEGFWVESHRTLGTATAPPIPGCAAANASLDLLEAAPNASSSSDDTAPISKTWRPIRGCSTKAARDGAAFDLNVEGCSGIESRVPP